MFVIILNSTYFKTGSSKKGPKIINDDYAPSFYLMNMVKDLDLAMDTACRYGLRFTATCSCPGCL